MKNFLHLYRFGEWLSEQGFNVIHPIKQADASWMQMLGITSSKELNIMMEHYLMVLHLHLDSLVLVK